MSSDISFDEKWAEQLSKDYDDYMWSCESSVDGEEPDDFTTLSGQPFCGCSTCYTREQLLFLVPRVIDAYKKGLVSVDVTNE